ncbi:MAG: YdiY family protein [Opitutales bacterium]
MLTLKLPHVLAFAFIASLLSASAAVIELTNGDRLTGELTRLDAERVRVSSPVFGEVILPVAQVANRDVLPAIEVPAATAAPATTTADAPAAEAEAETGPQPWYAFWNYQSPEKWDGEFSLGASRQSGNTERSDVNVALKLEWDKSEKDNFLWRANYNYGREDQVLNTDEWHVSMRYRRDIDKRWFLQSLTSNDTDDIAEVNWDIRQAFGLGYRAVMRDRLKIELVPGAGLRFLDQPGDDGFFFNASFIETLEWIIIEDRLTFDQSFGFFFDPTDTDIWEAAFEASLTTDLTDQWALRLGFLYEFDNSVGAGVDEEDTETTASLVYKF